MNANDTTQEPLSLRGRWSYGWSATAKPKRRDKRTFSYSGRWLLWLLTLFVVSGMAADYVNALNRADVHETSSILGGLFAVAWLSGVIRIIVSAAIATDKGVKIRNPLHCRSFAWDEIEEFTLHEPQAGPMYGRVELRGGGHFHIFAIMSGVMPYWEKKVRGQIAELNDLLHQHEGVLAPGEPAGGNAPRTSQRIADSGLESQQGEPTGAHGAPDGAPSVW